MVAISLSQEAKNILSRIIPGEANDTAWIFIRGLRDLLRECEQEILDFEIKYGCSFDEFKTRLEKGEWGDPFSYPLENDAMRWEDLAAEKKVRLEAIRGLEKIS